MRKPVRHWLSAGWHLARLALEAGVTVLGRCTSRSRRRAKGLHADEVWTSIGARSLRATPVETFSGTAALESNLTVVEQLLTSASLAHRIVRAGPETPRIEVTESGWTGLRGLLAEQNHSWYGVQGRRIIEGLPALQDEGVRQAQLFRVWGTARGDYLAGPDTAIQITAIPGPPGPSATEAPPFPIDAVITWVDGSHPRWQAKRDARRQMTAGAGHATATSAARWESIDELRFVLRSLALYAPWLQRIFLVTDGQSPAWLQQEDQRLVVVDHTEIFEDASALPTFNSHSIETQLHRIPGLAEHYIYFNDDVFLGRYLPPSAFFDRSGNLQVFLADEKVDPGPVRANDPPVVTAAKRNRDLLLELTGKRLEHKLKHVPHPQRRSLAEELYAAAGSHVTGTAHSPFRSPKDISFASSLLPHYALFTGLATVGTIAHFYADVASPELTWRLPPLLWNRDADIICLNATAAPSQQSR